MTKRESVWDYPRPPKVEPVKKTIEILKDGIQIAKTDRAYRVCETSHPPVYYIPPEDIRMDLLSPNGRRTICEFKGMAEYYDLTANGRQTDNVAWAYPKPAKGYEAIAGFLAFYAHTMSACTVGGKNVRPQPGDFYGGWITDEIEGPFKGGPGTAGW